LKDHGGAKAAVRAVRERLGENRFVLKTDVLARLRDSMKPIQSRAISLRA